MIDAVPRPCICLVTNRLGLASVTHARDPVDYLDRWLDAAVDVVDIIQLREPDLEGGALLALTRSVVRRTRGTRTRVLVNDRVDVAIVAGADGVHLRSDGPPVARIRAACPAPLVVGRSIHRPSEAAAERSADFLVYGTVFSSRSKADDVPVQGTANLRMVTGATALPVLAIGGVTPVRAAECAAAGAAGVAAISIFYPEGTLPEALGIPRAAAELRGSMRTAR